MNNKGEFGIGFAGWITLIGMGLLIVSVGFFMIDDIFETHEGSKKCSNMGYEGLTNKGGFASPKEWYCYKEVNGFKEYSREIHLNN